MLRTGIKLSAEEAFSEDAEYVNSFWNEFHS